MKKSIIFANNFEKAIIDDSKGKLLQIDENFYIVGTVKKTHFLVSCSFHESLHHPSFQETFHCFQPVWIKGKPYPINAIDDGTILNFDAFKNDNEFVAILIWLGEKPKDVWLFSNPRSLFIVDTFHCEDILCLDINDDFIQIFVDVDGRIRKICIMHDLTSINNECKGFKEFKKSLSSKVLKADIIKCTSTQGYVYSCRNIWNEEGIKSKNNSQNLPVSDSLEQILITPNGIRYNNIIKMIIDETVFLNTNNGLIQASFLLNGSKESFTFQDSSLDYKKLQSKNVKAHILLDCQEDKLTLMVLTTCDLSSFPPRKEVLKNLPEKVEKEYLESPNKEEFLINIAPLSVDYNGFDMKSLKSINQKENAILIEEIKIKYSLLFKDLPLKEYVLPSSSAIKELSALSSYLANEYFSSETGKVLKCTNEPINVLHISGQCIWIFFRYGSNRFFFMLDLSTNDTVGFFNKKFCTSSTALPDLKRQTLLADFLYDSTIGKFQFFFFYDNYPENIGYIFDNTIFCFNVPAVQHTKKTLMEFTINETSFAIPYKSTKSLDENHYKIHFSMKLDAVQSKESNRILFAYSGSTLSKSTKYRINYLEVFDSFDQRLCLDQFSNALINQVKQQKGKNSLYLRCKENLNNNFKDSSIAKNLMKKDKFFLCHQKVILTKKIGKYGIFECVLQSKEHFIGSVPLDKYVVKIKQGKTVLLSDFGIHSQFHMNALIIQNLFYVLFIYSDYNDIMPFSVEMGSGINMINVPGYIANIKKEGTSPNIITFFLDLSSIPPSKTLIFPISLKLEAEDFVIFQENGHPFEKYENKEDIIGTKVILYLHFSLSLRKWEIKLAYINEKNSQKIKQSPVTSQDSTKVLKQTNVETQVGNIIFTGSKYCVLKISKKTYALLLKTNCLKSKTVKEAPYNMIVEKLNQPFTLISTIKISYACRAAWKGKKENILTPELFRSLSQQSIDCKQLQKESIADHTLLNCIRKNIGLKLVKIPSQKVAQKPSPPSITPSPPPPPPSQIIQTKEIKSNKTKYPVFYHCSGVIHETYFANGLYILKLNLKHTDSLFCYLSKSALYLNGLVPHYSLESSKYLVKQLSVVAYQCEEGTFGKFKYRFVAAGAYFGPRPENLINNLRYGFPKPCNVSSTTKEWKNMKELSTVLKTGKLVLKNEYHPESEFPKIPNNKAVNVPKPITFPPPPPVVGESKVRFFIFIFSVYIKF